jgi:pimeloyl-ACP methyl ester carboxylesterase
MAEAVDHRSPPSKLLSLFEAPRALAEASMLLPTHRLLKKLPGGDGHSVMTLPGFLAGDTSTRVLRRYLKLWGYRPHPWRLGRNFGLNRRNNLEDQLEQRLIALHRRHQAKVSLIGWSLGGVFARELARKHPDKVRGVITLGSPLGNPRATNVWRLYEFVSNTRIEDADIAERIASMRTPIPVPATAIFSKTDSIVAWQIAQEPRSEQTESIKVLGSHLGLGFNPMVLYVIADRLHHLSNGGWRPFQQRRFNALMSTT